MKIIIEVESVEEARQVFTDPPFSDGRRLINLTDKLITAESELKAAEGLLQDNALACTRLVEERDRYKVALEDIAHGPVGIWNDPVHRGQVIKQFMDKAEEALHPKTGEE